MAKTKLSRLVPRHQNVLLACVVATSAADSVLVGYDSSLMGSLNVMPSYKNYFTLTTATTSLNTGISYVGGCTCSLISGFLIDWRGRKECIFWSSLITLIGGVIQGSAVDIGMFIAGRFICGFGMALAQTAAPTLVAEIAPVNRRAFALGLYYACWGVGTLIASGVCYETEYMNSNWAWRIPSLLQVAPALFVILIILFIPESPRWLVKKGRHEEALEVISIANGNGMHGDPKEDPIIAVQYREICDTIAWEKEQGLSFFQAITRKSNRRRLWISSTFSIMVMLPGTNIVTYYFGDILAGAGITSTTTQLEVNVILTSWTLVIALLGSWFADKQPRKWLCAGSLMGGIVTLYLLGGLSALYGTSTNHSGIYATVAMMFLYNATYSWGITPLTVLYPPEILSFDIRGIGMGIYTFATKLCGLFVTMAVPFGLAAISWKVYIINASIDILMVIYVIIAWVETRGLTLEEVDKIFDGEKHSSVPDLTDVTQGNVKVDAAAVLDGKIGNVQERVEERSSSPV